MTDITEIRKGDYVKVDGQLKKVESVYGVQGNYLAKPSEGGFGVITESGENVTMWQAERYFKKEEIDGNLHS